MANPNTAKFPSSIATDSDLPVATDSFSTTLTTSISSLDTSITGLSLGGLNVPAILKIDNELVLAVAKSGNTATSCVRGFSGSVATSHSFGASIQVFVCAWHFNQLAAEVKALETWLGISGANLPSPRHVVTLVIEGGGSPVLTGSLPFFPTIRYGGTISQVSISADRVGSITVDVWKRNAAIPTSSNKISATSPVTLSSAQLNQSSSITGWTTSIVADDVFGFSVASASTVTRVVIQIFYEE